MTVLIRNSLNPPRTDDGEIKRKAKIVLNALGSPEGELSLLITDDAEIAGYNKDYLNREGPTNVIAFPMQEGDCAGVNPYVLGDVVISAETAGREAGGMGISETERFDELLIHGILHLFGYDHETSEAEEKRMEAKTEELMALIRDA